MLKRTTIALILACLLLAAPAMAEQSPTERVKEGVDEIITILSNPDMANPEKHDEAISVLRKTAQKYISFRLACMYSVGKPWLDMSPKLQDELTEAFTDLLEHTYLQRIPSYGGENVEYEKEIVSGNKAKVFTKIVGKDKTFSVEFSLRQVDGVWMIFDTTAEGVSLVSNYRSQFSEILANSTPEELLAKIRESAKKVTEAQNPEQETPQ